MTFHLFMLFVCFCMLAVACLWYLYRSHHGPAHSERRLRSLVPRRLRPRSPLACPACRRSAARSSAQELSFRTVRPWREIKSRRGAPKRVTTEGFACPNSACEYSGITDAQVHALVGDGSHGRAERIQTFRCQACGRTFSARLHTPMYRLKTPSQQVVYGLPSS
jgi:hypothetical protein